MKVPNLRDDPNKDDAFNPELGSVKYQLNFKVKSVTQHSQDSMCLPWGLASISVVSFET